MIEASSCDTGLFLDHRQAPFSRFGSFAIFLRLPVGFDPNCVVPFRWIADAGSNGVVAQLGERCVRNAEVGGSTPLDSTSFFGPAIRKDCDR